MGICLLSENPPTLKHTVQKKNTDGGFASCLVENSSHCCEGTSVSNPIQCSELVLFINCLCMNCLDCVQLYIHQTQIVDIKMVDNCCTEHCTESHCTYIWPPPSPPFLSTAARPSVTNAFIAPNAVQCPNHHSLWNLMICIHDLLGIICIIAVGHSGAIVQ